MDSIYVTNFGTADWIIVAVYLLVVVSVGVVVNRYIHNVTDYMVGGRASGAALNSASYIGTGLGLVTIMYASIEGFTRGFSYVFLAVLGLVTVFAVGFSGLAIFRLRKLKLLTIPEYFEYRFTKRLRILTGIVCALAGILNMGLFPKMGAIFIANVTGLADSPNQVAIVNIIVTILVVLVVLYTMLGGMVSVLVTDYFQFLILSVGMGFGLYVCLTHAELGWENMTNTLIQYRGESGFNPFHTDSYGVTFIIWVAIAGISSTILWAPEASRALTCKDPQAAKNTFMLSSPGSFFRLACPALWAIAAFCLFSKNADFSAYFFPEGPEGPTAHAAEAMPLFIGKMLPSYLLGVLVAGLLAAFMSTHDSYLICWASVISRDIVSPLRSKPLSDKKQIFVTRLSVFIIGIFLIFWGIWYKTPDSVWTYMAITGNIYLAGTSVALIGGLYWSRASTCGAYASILCGCVSVLGLFLDSLQELLPWLTPGLLGLSNYVVCLFSFIFFSLVFPDKKTGNVQEG